MELDREVLPACDGRWELFDSVKRSDHEAAAQLCAICPVFSLCEIALSYEDVRHLTGTWAGQLFNVYTQTGKAQPQLAPGARP